VIACRCNALPPQDLYRIAAALRADLATVDKLEDLYSACPAPSDEGKDIDLSLVERSAVSVLAQCEQVRERLRYDRTRIRTDGCGGLAFTDDEQKADLFLCDEEADLVGELLLTQKSSPSNFWC
jgi:hypothetical protein